MMFVYGWTLSVLSTSWHNRITSNWMSQEPGLLLTHLWLISLPMTIQPWTLSYTLESRSVGFWSGRSRTDSFTLSLPLWMERDSRLWRALLWVHAISARDISFFSCSLISICAACTVITHHMLHKLCFCFFFYYRHYLLREVSPD